MLAMVMILTMTTIAIRPGSENDLVSAFVTTEGEGTHDEASPSYQRAPSHTPSLTHSRNGHTHLPSSLTARICHSVACTVHDTQHSFRRQGTVAESTVSARKTTT